MSSLRRHLRPLGQTIALAALLVSAACGAEAIPPRYPARVEPRPFISWFGAPGEVTHMPPGVVVKNQYGLPVGGIEVRFEATLGSIEHTRVVTDAMGVATAGKWTLRGTEGEDVVTATVDGLPEVRFRARVRVPVELARYELVSQGSYTVESSIGGSISFYADDTFMYRITRTQGDGQLRTVEVPGLYARNDRAVYAREGAPFDILFVAQISATGLTVDYRSFDWENETYKVVSTVPPWP